MSTTPVTPPVTAPGQPLTLDLSQTPPTSFGRLVRVETRKMLDTRGGFWLVLISAILLVVAFAVTLLVIGLSDDTTVSANAWSQILVIPLSLLLPAVAIVSVTSEWSQRTGLVSFALEPRRSRVVLAKLASVVGLVAATVVLAFVLGSIGTEVGAVLGGYDADWNLGVRVLVLTVVVQLLYYFMAFGLGMTLLSTPAAISVFYVVGLILPFIVYGTLYALFGWARSVIPWIDLQFGTAPFTAADPDLSGVDYARLVTVTIIWVVLPLLIGTRRVLQSEPK